MQKQEHFNFYIDKLMSTERGCFVILTNDNNEKKFLSIDPFEGATLSFHYTGFSRTSHIKTMPEILKTFLESSDYKIDKIIFENYENEIGYFKIELIKNKSKIYFFAGIADGLILSVLSGCQMFIKNKIWEELEFFDEQNLTTFDQDF